MQRKVETVFEQRSASRELGIAIVIVKDGDRSDGMGVHLDK